jgi:GNAT superfamily N-acetyltransferase
MQLFDPIPSDYAQALEAGLNDHNGSTILDRSEFLIGELEDGRLIAGLRATVSRAVLYIKHLWVDKPMRQRGLGAKLVKAAEAEGMKRGARQGLVDTFSNQAPEFYETLGYAEFGRLSDIGSNGDLYRVWLKKTL